MSKIMFTEYKYTPRKDDVLIEQIIKFERKSNYSGIKRVERDEVDWDDCIEHPFRGKVISVGIEQKEFKAGDIVYYHPKMMETIILNSKVYVQLPSIGIKGKIEDTKREFEHKPKIKSNLITLPDNKIIQ